MSSNNTALVLKGEREIARETKGLIYAVKFYETKRSGFEALVRIAKKASLFIEQLDEGKRVFLVGFGRDREQGKLAFAFMEENRVSGAIKYVLFAQGRVQSKKFAVLNMLDCFCTASKLKDPSKHCQLEIDSPIERFQTSGIKASLTYDVLGDPEPETEIWTLPCRELEGFLRVKREDMKDPTGAIEAAAEERLLNACPYFNKDAFRKTHLVKGKKPKAYW